MKQYINPKSAQLTSFADRSSTTKQPHTNQKGFWLALAVRFGYIFLFTYTGYSKLITIDTFIAGIRKVPFFGQFAELIGWGIPVLELALALGMVIQNEKIRLISFRISVLIMGIFTLYLAWMISFVEHKLCHCGGVIESLGWPQHLLFNFVWLILGIWSIRKNNSLIK